MKQSLHSPQKRYFPIKKDLQPMLRSLKEWCGNLNVISRDIKGYGARDGFIWDMWIFVWTPTIIKITYTWVKFINPYFKNTY